MKYALKAVPGQGDVGVPHGDGQGPQSYTLMSVAVRNNVSNDWLCPTIFLFSLKIAPKTVSAVSDARVPHEDGPQSSTLLSGGVRKSFNWLIYKTS